jgi:hypothetical protein
VTVELETGNDPPTPKENVPEDPAVELRVCDPLAVLVSVTVKGVPEPDIWKFAGMPREKVCPPSPLTLYVARVGAGEARPIAPVPERVRLPVAASIDTDPVPLVGRTMRPKASPVLLAILIGRKTFAMPRPAVEPVIGMVGDRATYT